MSSGLCCQECGKDLVVRQKVYCSNICKLKNKDNILKRTKPKEKLNPNIIIVCKLTGKYFKDYKNYSGTLTKHLRSLNKDLNDLSEYFYTTDNPNALKPTYNCKYCDWTTLDINNKTGCITSHIEDNHKIEIKDHIKKYKQDTSIFEYKNKNNDRADYFLKNPTAYIECQVCKKKLKKITESHLKTHNLNTESYRLKYKEEVLSSLDNIEKCKLLYENNRDKINIKTKCSKAESEIYNHILTIDENTKSSVKNIISPYELDIYSEKYKIAIEYNGLAYHSEKFGNKKTNYHLNKTKMCEEKGIRLIHIFEDEWVFKKDIVISKLNTLFLNNTESIGARKCDIKIISTEQKNNFLDSNHIQGSDKSLYKIGLYYSEELVAVMTFCKPRVFMGTNQIKEGCFELSRYATSKNIVGGASKLLKYFINNYKPTQIISYADRRWSTNIGDTMYDKIGFTKDRVNKPNYWYLKSYKVRYHRFNFTKNNIVKKLNGNPDKTEVQNMFDLGYDRIWDCGTIKYVMHIENL